MNANVPRLSENLVSFLKTTTLFGDLDEETLRSVSRLARITSLKAGQPIWTAGDKAKDYTVIKRGVVQICRTTRFDEICTLALFGARESIGIHAVLGPRIYPANAVILTNAAEVCQFDAAALDQLMANNLTFSRNQSMTLVNMYFALQDKIDVMAAGTVPERLFELFEYLAKRFGDEDEEGKIIIPIRLSRNHLANMVSARIETVIRVLSTWQKQRILVSQELGFVWDRTALQESLSEQKTNIFWMPAARASSSA